MCCNWINLHMRLYPVFLFGLRLHNVVTHAPNVFSVFHTPSWHLNSPLCGGFLSNIQRHEGTMMSRLLWVPSTTTTTTPTWHWQITQARPHSTATRGRERDVYLYSVFSCVNGGMEPFFFARVPVAYSLDTRYDWCHNCMLCPCARIMRADAPCGHKLECLIASVRYHVWPFYGRVIYDTCMTII